jgi:hypothetical protein
MVVLGFLMLLYGGHLLVKGISQLDGSWADRMPPEGASVQLVEDLRVMNEAMAQAYREHPVSVAINAGVKTVVGLCMLFAVAALFALDPRARRATMLAAGVQILYQVIDTPFQFQTAAPALVKLTSRQMAAAGSSVGAPALVAVVIVGSGLLWVLFSVLLLTFFGGRRGRTFFGVGADVVRRQPHHGG